MQQNKPKKHFGQNFLQSESILKKIISESKITKDDVVIEIGPGRGALTKYLVKQAKKVYAFEIDKSLHTYLTPIQKDNINLEVMYEDILNVDLETFIEANIKENVKVVANIPYYITSPIIFKLLETPSVDEMTLLIQKEVADRLASQPNSKDYAAVTVIIQALTKVEKLIQVKRTAFYPAPNVDSTVIKLTKHQNEDIKDFKRFDVLVKAAFKQKRKTLLNNLSVFVDQPKSVILEQLQLIDPKYDQYTRAESLTIEDFVSLSNRWFV